MSLDKGISNDDAFNAYITQIEYIAKDENIGQWPKLMSCVTIPDICGALSSKKGEATGSSYKCWSEDWVIPLLDKPDVHKITGDTLWAYRCSLLHQGYSKHNKIQFSKIAFCETLISPKNLTIENGVVGQTNQIYLTNIPAFIAAYTQGARNWYTKYGSTNLVSKNIEHLSRVFPDGYFEGSIQSTDFAVFC